MPLDRSFSFGTAGQILFGPGRVGEVPGLVAGCGRKALVVTGWDVSRASFLVDGLHARGVETTLFAVETEPTVELVDHGLRLARASSCDVVVGLGGGSALDTAKLLAALATNAEPWMDYLEVIGAGKPLAHPALPLIAVPTTAGTGAEVTRNAVVGSPAHRVKVSLRHAYLLPRYAVVDPELTYSMSPSVTAASGLDAVTQLVEVFVSRAATPLTDALCRAGLPLASHLRAAWLKGADREARAGMSLAALYSGMALSHAGLGAVHGLAGPLGGAYAASHGAICARLLPVVMAANWRALQERDAGSAVLARFDEVGRLLTGDPAADAMDGVTWVRALRDDLGIPGLSQFGLEEAGFVSVIEQSRASSSMRGNPIVLTDEELACILAEAL